MTESVRFFVPGEPKPAGSKRGFVVQKQGERPRAVVTDVTGQRGRDWRSDIRTAAEHAMKQATPLEGALGAQLTFYMKRPWGHYGSGKNLNRLKPAAPFWHTSRPDVDKLSRAVLDALKGIVWLDDSQVAWKLASKPYANRHLGRQYGAEVVVFPIVGNNASQELKLAV